MTHATADTLTQSAAPTIAKNVTDFSQIAGTTNYQHLLAGYQPGSMLSQADIAATGWDVSAQSYSTSGPFLIRGINSSGNGDGDTSSIRFQASDIDHVTFASNTGGFYFDLTSFAVRNNENASFSVQALDAAGNPVGASVPFSISGSPPPASGNGSSGAFTPISLAGNPDFLGIYGFRINFTSGSDAPFFDNLVVANIGIPGAPAVPTTTVDTASLLYDTGLSDSDFMTNVAGQTIDGTLSAALVAGEKVEVSYDNGNSWSDATSFAVGSSAWSSTTTLAGSGIFLARVSNADGSSEAFDHAYTLDVAKPTTPAAPDLRNDDDSGGSGLDNLTNVTAPILSGSVEAGATVTLYDTDGSTVLGKTVAVGGSWSITSSTLSQGTHTLTVTATDLAGNVSDASPGLTVTIDTAAPTGLALSTTKVATSAASHGAALATLSASDSSALTYALALGDGLNNADNDKLVIAGNSLSVGSVGLVAGTYRIYLSATDAAGNVSYLAQSITVQSIPVVTSIVRADDADSGLPADATSASYTMTFSEDVFGVDASDFVLTGTGSAGGAVSQVTGSGSSYTITVSGLGGDGTLRLDLKGSGTGIESGDGIAIGGGYTAGETYLLDHTEPAVPSAPSLAFDDDSGSSNLDNITKVTEPTFSGTAEDGTIVTLYDTDGTTVLGTDVASGGAWSITSSALADGTHSLTVKAVDAAGNESPASPALDVTIDTAAAALAAPALASASDSGAVGDGITNVATPTITGTAEAYASIALYDTDGVTVLGTATANEAGKWSITSSALSTGVHTLTAKQVDAAGNESDASMPLALTIEAPVTTPTQPPQPPSTVIDGVPVQAQPVALPGGGGGTQVIVPVIVPGRDETTGSADLADIPLASAGGSMLLLAQLPQGFGLSAVGGASRPAGDSAQQLIAAIKAATPGHGSGDQGHLVGNGAGFLAMLDSGTPLLVQTVTPTAITAPLEALVLTGTSSAEQRTALVIDASGLPAGSKLALNAVDFAALIGSVDVSVGTGNQVISGDAASQRISVSAQHHGSVFAGGGSDALVFGQQAGTAQRAGDMEGGTTLLHGGLGADAAVFSGNMADYTIERHESYVVVAGRAQPEQRALLINVESLQFADIALALDYHDAQAAIAGIYREALQRQADYLGIDFWTSAQKNGFSLGQIAIEIIGSSEARATGIGAFNGDAGNDLKILYQGIFGRESDTGGLAFWLDAMNRGASLESVASAFMQSAEIEVHEIGVQDSDFTLG